MPSRVAVVAGIAVAAAALAVWLFPRALPIVALEQSLTRDRYALATFNIFRFREKRRPGPGCA